MNLKSMSGNMETNIDDNMNIDFWVYTDAKEGEDTHVDESNHMIYIKREYTRDEDALYHTYSKQYLLLEN